MLHNHCRYVHHHQNKGNEVHDRKNSNYQELVINRRDRKRDENADGGRVILAAQWKINMPVQEIVDWHVPLFPVLAQIVCVPPVAVETSVSKHSKLGKQIHKDMEKKVKNS